MQIGHTGHTRPLELIVAGVLLAFAVLVAMPIHSAVYTGIAIKLVFSVLFAGPAVWLMCARGMQGRKKALLAVLLTYAYSGLLALAVAILFDASRFGVSAAIFGLTAITAYLYFVTAWEIKWERSGSSRSAPP